MPEYGPYEQPGWPTSLPYFKPAETFRNAFGMASEINRRKQQLENQMMAMSLRAQQNEITNELRVADFKRKLDQGDQRLEMAQQAMNLRETIHQDALNKDREKFDQIGNLTEGLAATRRLPLDQQENAAYSVIASNSAGAKAAPFLVKNTFGEIHNEVRGVRKQWSSDYNELVKQVTDTIGLGQLKSLNLIYNLDQWKPQWKSKSTGQTVGEPVTEAQKQDYEKTGKWTTLIPSGVPNQPPVAVTYPASLITNFNRRIKDLDARKSKLPTPPAANDYFTPPAGTGENDSGTVTIRASDGKQWKVPASAIPQVKQRDPDVVIIP